MIQTIKYSKLSPDAISPSRKNSTDAGMDFYSLEDVYISPNSMKIIHTGISVEIPENFMLLLKPKSKNNYLVGAGIIDSFYEPGEILVKITNITNQSIKINKGDAIAQGIYIQIETPTFIEVDKSELINNKNRSGTGGIVNQLK